ncbi:MAG TPA: isoaspartyl peptidase/L-asparaginase [Chitinophagaceae bacterium]|nr:isoaspartyl peptidase/L-asparaginase [Chitinophagaceae bacterium]
MFTLVIHGGAGTILRKNLTDELEKAYRDGLQAALDAGFAVLHDGGTSLEAVKATVICMEDNILFNAGKGSVFSNKGGHEMDAAVMDGATLKAGAVAAIRNVRNPIVLAYEVMNHTEHVLLAGEGANEFALQRGVAFEHDDYFYSQYRYDQWRQVFASGETILDHTSPRTDELMKDKKFGTVGAVACDQHGNIAAATSTGGMTNKQYGRIGDSPITGAGNYANNKTCAISCTGHGEIFMRAVAAYDVSCLMEYKGKSLQEAMEIVVHTKLKQLDGEGGMIGVDAQGNGAMVFNIAGMYRGIRNSKGLNEIGIYQ